MFKIMKGYKIFAFTPSGKSLKKTLFCMSVAESIVDIMILDIGGSMIVFLRSHTKKSIVVKRNITTINCSKVISL